MLRQSASVIHIPRWNLKVIDLLLRIVDLLLCVINLLLRLF